MKLNSKFALRKRSATRLGSLSIWLVLAATLLIQNVIAQTLDDKLFVEAMRHIEDRQWAKAEAILEFQLEQNESWHRARVELAVVYAKQGKTKLALSEIDRVLNLDSLPQAVRNNVESVRQEVVNASTAPPPLTNAGLQVKTSENILNTEPEHKVESSLEFSFGYDDNVQFSSGEYFFNDDPFLDGVFLEQEDGTIIYIAPDGFIYDIQGNQLFENNGMYDLGDPDRSNSFIESSLYVQHVYHANRWNDFKWKNSLQVQANENQKFSDFNKLQFKLNSQLSWQLTDRLKLELEGRHRLLKRDGKVQVKSTGIEPRLTYYTEMGSWELGYEFLKRKYEDAFFTQGDFISVFNGFESDTITYSFKWSNLFLNNKLLLLAKLEYLDSNSSDNFDYTGTRTTLAAVYSINERWTWSFSALNFDQKYEPANGFLTDQNDDSQIFKTKLSYDISDSIELFISGERGLRSSEFYGGIQSDKSLTNLGIKFRF